MKRLISIAVILGITLSLSACGTSSTPTTTLATTSVSAASSLEATIKATTAVETTPAATDSVISVLAADQVLTKIKDAGLPVSNIVVYDEKSDPNGTLGRPGSYTSKVSFSDPAHEDSDKSNPDNTIEVFDTEADAKTRADYVDSVTKGTAMAQYIYQVGMYVMRLDYDVLPADAQKYDDALIAAVS